MYDVPLRPDIPLDKRKEIRKKERSRDKLEERLYRLVELMGIVAIMILQVCIIAGQ